MNKDQLNALRKAAKEATPGPWCRYLNTIDDVIVRKMNEAGYEQCVISYKSHYKNADYIAAANPQAILQLLDYIEALEKDAARFQWLLNDQDSQIGICDLGYDSYDHPRYLHKDEALEAIDAAMGETK